MGKLRDMRAIMDKTAKGKGEGDLALDLGQKDLALATNF